MGACCCRVGRSKCRPNEVSDTDSLLGQPEIELQLANGESGSGRKNSNKTKHKNSDCDDDLEQLVNNSSRQTQINSPSQMKDRFKISSDSVSHPTHLKEVRFGTVAEREYARCMDFHPCVSTGVPIGLDWDFEEIKAVSIDEFEAQRSSERINRQDYAGRGRLEPRLRLALALRAGHEVHEIESMNKKVEIARVERYNDFLEAQADLRAKRQQQLAEKQRQQRQDRASSIMMLGSAIGKKVFSTWLLVTQGDGEEGHGEAGGRSSAGGADPLSFR